MWRIAALPPLPVELIDALFADVRARAEFVVPRARDESGLHEALAEADAVIGDFTGELALDAAAVAAAPRLAFVQMPQVGVDSCDIPALTRAGVAVANTPGANTRAVAEWAVGAAFALCRRLAWADRRMREGGWPQLEIGGRELHAQHVGIVGYGAIGAEAARLFSALGCRVSYWSRTPRAEAVAEYLPLRELLAVSGVLVVALPLTAETRGLIGPSELALLPPGALLVNVARGGIVPDAAVLDALDSGALGGAALDVYETEPLPERHPLRSHENVLLSPHAAGASGQAQIAIIGEVVANLTRLVSGEPVKHVVNGLGPRVTRRPPSP
ncbi:NAD(P)-dependent oxidoreductase [Actinocorallia sp. A-T 12471]|uniref:NAD(P)-dependent oxidoreductase n=1 Tax=Actinocorallia sp. A-T 12471 TaxID=3089813 RepID=UPI0029CB9D5C|nr:NAD(P)-dependent oxidoreductase [Actinocorallia sp. A-T 12471]MDX6738433.1 NAD(P)-dependent oxidoreductase [Actinocorallia sp. A-T 12471]